MPPFGGVKNSFPRINMRVSRVALRVIPGFVKERPGVVRVGPDIIGGGKDRVPKREIFRGVGRASR